MKSTSTSAESEPLASTCDMQDSHDQTVDTLISGGADYAVEILARVREAHWVDALETEIHNALVSLAPVRT